MTSGAGDDEPFSRGFDDGDMMCSDLDRWHASVDLLFRFDLAVGASDSCDPSMSAHVP
jgi:hypothetical protein